MISDQQKKTGELNANQQSEVGREKTTAIRLFEMIQKSITVIFVQLCVLLYSIMAFFKFYFEIVQVKKFNHSLMVDGWGEEEEEFASPWAVFCGATFT